MSGSASSFDGPCWWRLWSSTGDIRENATAQSSKNLKKVSYSGLPNEVFLIPNREEIVQVELWWSADDLLAFKNDAVKEVREYLRIHEYADSKAALTSLYQPEVLVPYLF